MYDSLQSGPLGRRLSLSLSLSLYTFNERLAKATDRYSKTHEDTRSILSRCLAMVKYLPHSTGYNRTFLGVRIGLEASTALIHYS
jgi:hypothetical protein